LARAARASAEQQVAALRVQAATAPVVESARVAPGLAEQQTVVLAAKRRGVPSNPVQAERPSSRLAAPALLNRVT
jgi:hypothetical protein